MKQFPYLNNYKNFKQFIKKRAGMFDIRGSNSKTDAKTSFYRS